MHEHLQQARELFERAFGGGGRVRIIRAPGRVNLIGEHTDYNDGLVCPMAIEPSVMLVCRGRADAKITVKSAAYPEHDLHFTLQAPIAAGPKGDWTNYVLGPAAMLLLKGVPLVGMDCLILNSLPPGSGLSSSAAMEVGTMLALLTLAGHDMQTSEIVRLAQKAEHDYAQMPCGIMDQSIVAGGKAGHAMLLDCRDLSTRFIPINHDDLRVVIVNSGYKHQLVDSEYADRRAQCEAAVAHFQKIRPTIRALRDVEPELLESQASRLDSLVYQRARHVVGEIQRCRRFADLLESQQYEQAGELMIQSHNSLRDDYQVSVPQLDFLVELAMNQKGVYGSRMTGAGFGGCTVSLVQPRAVESFAEHIRADYMKKYDLNAEVIVTTATAGASVIE